MLFKNYKAFQVMIFKTLVTKGFFHINLRNCVDFFMFKQTYNLF